MFIKDHHCFLYQSPFYSLVIIHGRMTGIFFSTCLLHMINVIVFWSEI